MYYNIYKAEWVKFLGLRYNLIKFLNIKYTVIIFAEKIIKIEVYF